MAQRSVCADINLAAHRAGRLATVIIQSLDFQRQFGGFGLKVEIARELEREFVLCHSSFKESVNNYGSGHTPATEFPAQLSRVKPGA